MTYYMGQIELFAGNFAPSGTAFCEGQHLSVTDVSALFGLIGTTYGGDGMNTFALPDLRGRVAIGTGAGPGRTARALGETGGQEMVTLTPAQIAAHTHDVMGRDAHPVASDGTVLGQWATYAPPTSTALAMAPGMVLPEPSQPAQPHSNMQPYQALNYIICIIGPYPSGPSDT